MDEHFLVRVHRVAGEVSKTLRTGTGKARGRDGEGKAWGSVIVPWRRKESIPISGLGAGERGGAGFRQSMAMQGKKKRQSPPRRPKDR